MPRPSKHKRGMIARRKFGRAMDAHCMGWAPYGDGLSWLERPPRLGISALAISALMAGGRR